MSQRPAHSMPQRPGIRPLRVRFIAVMIVQAAGVRAADVRTRALLLRMEAVGTHVAGEAGPIVRIGAAVPGALPRQSLVGRSKDAGAADGYAYVAGGAGGLTSFSAQPLSHGASEVLRNVSRSWGDPPLNCTAGHIIERSTYRYHCNVAPGHRIAIELQDYDAVPAAQAGFDLERGDRPAESFHGYAAFTRQYDERPRSAESADAAPPPCLARRSVGRACRSVRRHGPARCARARHWRRARGNPGRTVTAARPGRGGSARRPAPAPNEPVVADFTVALRRMPVMHIHPHVLPRDLTPPPSRPSPSPSPRSPSPTRCPGRGWPRWRTSGCCR